MFAMFSTSPRYCTLIDTIERLNSWINGLFMSRSLKSTVDKLPPFWLYPNHLEVYSFSNKCGFRGGFYLRLIINFNKSLTIRINRNLCRISIIPQLSVQSCYNRPVYISDSILHRKVLYLLWLFGFFLVSDVIRFEIFTTWFQFCLNAFCRYRVWKLPNGIRLNRGREIIWDLWFVQSTSSCRCCSFGDWATFRKGTRPLRNFHSSPLFFTSLTNSLFAARGSPAMSS